MNDLASAQLAKEVRRRRTFAIISHPDAGKTTLTEKLLLFSGAIQIAGSVKARKASRHATSDWMEIDDFGALCLIQRARVGTRSRAASPDSARRRGGDVIIAAQLPPPLAPV